MAIDTTPSTVATNALDALDFSSLIGGPMDAIIKAQALAAKTTYEFIKEVGLTVDPDTGEVKPINVTFQYNNGGKVATLTVPLLVILTVPNIEVSNFVIDFIANISASSSSTEETSSDSALGVDAEAEASLGVGPFSIKVKAKANYSSKQHSKAAQESKYSVEYTMNVKVEGGQSDMPAGLQTVLSILQGSNTSVSADEFVIANPSSLLFDDYNEAIIEFVVKDRQGYLAPGTKVELTFDPNSPFETPEITRGHAPGNVVASSLYGSKSQFSTNRRKNGNRPVKHVINHRVVKPYIRRFGNKLPLQTWNLATSLGMEPFPAITDQDGTVAFKLTLKDDVTQSQDGSIGVTAYIPIHDGKGESSTRREEMQIIYNIIVPDPSLQLDPNQQDYPTNTSGTIAPTVTVTNMGEPVGGEEVNYTIKNSDGTDATGKFTNVTGSATTDATTGVATFSITATTAPAGTYKLIFTNDSADPVACTITVS